MFSLAVGIGHSPGWVPPPPHSLLFSVQLGVFMGCLPAVMGLGEKGHIPSLSSHSLSCRSTMLVKHSYCISHYYFSSFHVVYFILCSFHICLSLFKDNVEMQERNNLI